MTVISVNQSNIVKCSKSLNAGDILQLDDVDYKTPVILNGISGTFKKPIIIRSAGNAKFTSGENFEAARLRINRLVKQRQDAGYYPSIGQTADEAWLTLKNCKYVVIESLKFEDCWPGSIYIDQCQQITIRDVHFLRGTIAIGANGSSCRDILVEDCSWKQDTSVDHAMWKKIPWTRIHGHSSKPGDKEGVVSIKEDYRLYDGDFFRAWEIPGNVTIRNNYISDAFNGIHFFNRQNNKTKLDDEGKPVAGSPNGAANVLIEHNTFVRIRDNIIEPEESAWNWVVRHNAFLDFYRLFSLEMQYGGYFYVYGNVGWQRDFPGPKTTNGDGGVGSLMKLGKITVGAGPFYFFHNSWELYARVASKYSIRNFHHFNNLVSLSAAENELQSLKIPWGEVPVVENESQLLGAINRKSFGAQGEALERWRFTARWESLSISSDGDVIHHSKYPETYKKIGMNIGENAKNANPGFKGGSDVFKAFQTAKKFPSSSLTIKLPFGKPIQLKAGQQCGAVNSDGSLFNITKEFGWISVAKKSKKLTGPGSNLPDTSTIS